MLPRADLNGPRPVAYIEAPAATTTGTDARQEVFQRLNQIAIGQHLQGKVLERQADGTHLVRLADTTARMSLPAGTRTGDELTFTLVERSPRPTFALSAGDPAGGDATTTLSSAARLIDRLLQTAQQGGGSTAVIGRVPVLPDPAVASSQMAAALADAVDTSGLFYESHLAQWAAGSRSLAMLMREPQAGGDTTQNTDAALLRHLTQQWTAQGRPLEELAQQLQTRAGAQSLNGLLTEPAQTAQMINAQLNTLEHQRFAWHGELWPGAPMEWEVGRDAPERRPEQRDQPERESWHSVVRFELPNIGPVSATLRLQGERVTVLVETDSPDSSQLLRRHGHALSEALAAAGLPLDGLLIRTKADDGQA